MQLAHRYAATGLFMASLLTTLPAQSRAQDPSYRYQPADQRAYDNGYRDGLMRGEEDARGRRVFSFARNPEYRDADLGYRSGEIDLSEYRRAFRQGFEAGYTAAYDRAERDYRTMPRAAEPIPPVGPRSEYMTAAEQIGFRDGYDAGVKDARDRESSDPVRSDRYRDADHHYNSRYGSRELFKRDYRVGFEQGYEQGYRVGR
jgi:hypothetical protein